MAEIIACNGNELTIQVTVKLSGSLIEMENTVLNCCNEVACLATKISLTLFTLPHKVFYLI